MLSPKIWASKLRSCVLKRIRGKGFFFSNKNILNRILALFYGSFFLWFLLDDSVRVEIFNKARVQYGPTEPRENPAFYLRWMLRTGKSRSISLVKSSLVKQLKPRGATFAGWIRLKANPDSTRDVMTAIGARSNPIINRSPTQLDYRPEPTQPNPTQPSIWCARVGFGLPELVWVGLDWLFSMLIPFKLFSLFKKKTIKIKA